MFQWLREYYDIRREKRELERVCLACEVFKVELAQERIEKQRLLNHILHPVAEIQTTADTPEPVMPKHVPWRVRQQELEQKDRLEHQRIMTEFRNKVVNTEKLEKEMGIN